jgi:hypothetical protein
VLRGAPPGTRSAEAGQRFLAYGSTEAAEVAVVFRHIVNSLFRKFRKAWYAPHVPTARRVAGARQVNPIVTLAKVGALFYRLRVKSGNSSAANAVSARIKRRRVVNFPFFLFYRGPLFSHCDTQKLSNHAWSLFGHIQGGRARARAICQYVHYRHLNSPLWAVPSRQAKKKQRRRTCLSGRAADLRRPDAAAHNPCSIDCRRTVRRGKRGCTAR